VVAASAAVALTPASVQLAPWTVAGQADGSIAVTIRELEDPAGLQSAPHADGVPASVTFSGQHIPACQPYPAGDRTDPIPEVVQDQQGHAKVMIIDPSALPTGARPADQRHQRPGRARARARGQSWPGISQPAVHRQLSRPLLSGAPVKPSPILSPS
jgi:hypothetical protein